MSFADRLTEYIRAGYPALAIETVEESRLERALSEVAEAREGEVWAWTATDGLYHVGNGSREEVEPHEVVPKIRDMGHKKNEPSPERYFLLYDWLYYAEDDPTLCRQVRDAVKLAKQLGDYLIFCQPQVQLPRQLQEEVARIDFPLPTADDLAHTLEVLHEGEGSPKLPKKKDRTVVLEASKGLTVWGAENAYALSIVRKGRVEPEVVANEKARMIRQSGLLTLYEPHPTDSMDHIGGLDAFKDWLLLRQDAFGEEARAFGLDTPKGVLTVGVPGCGKSAMAKATAIAWRRPLLRLDMGALFAGIVGESEANQRISFQLAEAVAPCILWLDEIEKGLAGTQNSLDSGVGARLFGNLLYWMQEKDAPVFVFATSNDVSALPPELLRKGRFDEIWWVDLPRLDERMEILRIHLEKRGRDPKTMDLGGIAGVADEFSGAEIEGCIKEALFTAFSEKRELAGDDIAQAISATSPLASTAKEKLAKLRNWACGRARPATSVKGFYPTTGKRRVEKGTAG